jgi:hypothetical protein
MAFTLVTGTQLLSLLHFPLADIGSFHHHYAFQPALPNSTLQAVPGAKFLDKNLS